MRIGFVTKDDVYIAHFEVESNPFKVDEIININISNNDKQLWTVEDVHKSFKIENIEHFLRIDFNSNKIVYTYFDIIIEVSELT